MPSAPSPQPSSLSNRPRFPVGVYAWMMLGATLVAQPAGAPADPLEVLFKQGAEAYSKNDYATTIARFNQLLKTAKPGPALEPVYFTLAAARLRLGDTNGAVDAFRLYLQLYPAGAQIADAPDTTLRDRLHLADDAPVIAQARLRYYQASLLRLTRKPAEAVRLLASLGRELPPAQLSAPILAEAGDALLAAGETEKTSEFFNALLARFPGSAYRDYSYVGMGDLALQRGEPAVALKAYEDAIDIAGAQHRLREATVGKARALFALDRLDEAGKLFETIAAAKEWRGEATALSLHHLGLVAVKRGDLPKGIAFFQRVFVSQGRSPEWVAKSYWACGQAFEKLGKSAEAAATYREMLRNERIRAFPETALATQRLAALATP